MNEACETLAATGNNQLLILGGSVLLILVGLFVLKKRGFVVKILPIILLLFLGLYSVSPITTYAQSAEDCLLQAGQEESQSPAPVTSLTLQDDTSTMQLPDGGNPTTVHYMTLLVNDTPPSDDPLDWNTLDIDTGQVGIQQSRSILHPDDSAYSCGVIDVLINGMLRIALEYTCYDNLANPLTIDNDFVIAPFDYTVASENNVTTDSPATVTVSVTATPAYVVNGVQDSLECEASQTIDILANDSTTIGTLDPDTIDLDPNKPGIQQTYSYVHTPVSTPYTYTATVVGGGSIIVTTEASTSGMTFFYTVSNTNGDTSQVTLINGDSCA